MRLWQSEKDSNRQGFVGLWESSDALNPTFKIPLITSPASVPSGLVSTYTRNSIATYIEDGLVKTAGIDVIRFQNDRYLCESAATNLIANSENLTNWSSGSGGCSITLNYIQTPLGIFSAKLSQIDSTADNIYKTLTLVTSTKYCMSIFVKNVDAVKSRINIWNIGGGVSQADLIISWTGETPSTYSSSGITDIEYLDNSDGWYLIRFCTTTGGAGSSYPVTIYPEYGAIAAHSIYLTKVQFESSMHTSYIQTTTTNITRAADVLHYNVGDVITQGQGSLYCEFVGMSSFGVIKTLLTLSDNTFNNRIYPYIAVDGKITLKGAVGGADTLTITGGTILSTLNKILVTYKAGETKLYFNGALVGTSTAYTVPASLTKLNVGSLQDGTYQLNSEIGTIKYFKEVLTSAEAIKITTL